MKKILPILISTVIGAVIWLVIENAVDSIAPRGENGNTLIWLGGLSSTFVITSVLALPIAVSIAFFVDNDILQQAKSSNLSKLWWVLRVIFFWILILFFAIFFSIPT